jgi:repressor LexA
MGVLGVSLRRPAGVGKACYQPKALEFAVLSPILCAVLTRRQKELLDFIRRYIKRRGYAPSLAEMRVHLKLSSLATVHKHLRLLEEKGAIRRLPGRSRALEVRTTPADAQGNRVPLLGRVAAGTPIEPIEVDESVTIPDELLGHGETFALRVQGDSMIDDGIHDGDVVLVERQATADNAQTVVALLDGEATIKRFYQRRDGVHLEPANPALSPVVVSPERVEIRGVVVALLRRYR